MTLATLTGFRFFDRGRRGYTRWELRFSWAEITGRLGFALALCLFDEHYSLHLHLGWPNLFIRLPFLQRWHRDPYECMESWGATWVGPDSIHLNWGRACKILHMPWSATWVRTSLLLADGSWVHETRKRRPGFPNYPLEHTQKRPWGTWHKIKEEHAWRETHPYRYVLRSGEVQERQATITVEEREWRWRWLVWLPFPRGIQRSIDVSFDHELGERTGSWKGGCTGCGYTLFHDELPKDALRRMEQERKF